jgi:hypothetical protein
MSYLIEITFTLSVLANVFLLIVWKYERKNAKEWERAWRRVCQQRDKVSQEYYDLLDTFIPRKD